MTTVATFIAPLGRFFLGLIFVLSGVSKIGVYEGTQGFMEMMGVPGALLPATIAFEIIAGLALIVGFRARFASILLAGFSVVAGVIFHLIPSINLDGMEAQIQSIMFMKNLAIAGGLLIIVSQGAGAFAVDNRSAQPAQL